MYFFKKGKKEKKIKNIDLCVAEFFICFFFFNLK